MDENAQHQGLPAQSLTESNPQSEETVIAPQNETLSPSNPQLSPCDYCAHKEKYQSLIDDYIARSAAKTGDKVSVPFVEEIALILKKEYSELVEWKADETHKEFNKSIQKLLLIQRLRLLQRASGRFQPQGAIFLLEKLHQL